MATPNNPCPECYPPIPATFTRDPVPPLVVPTVLGTAFLATLCLTRGLRLRDRLVFFYFAVSLWIHFGLERFYVHHVGEILESSSVVAALWRNYGVSDTRWLGQQPLVPRSQYSCIWGLEVMAAYVAGPLILLSAAALVRQQAWRWVVQAVAGTVQAYGLLITWLPAYYEGHRSVATSDPVLFYGYYVAMQAPWLVIPALLCVQAVMEVQALARQQAQVVAEPSSRKRK